MYTLTRFDPHLRLSAGQRLYLLRVNTRGIHDMASTYSQLLIAERVMNMHSTYFTLLADKGGHFRIVGDLCSIFSGSADESQSEASIIGLRVLATVTVFQSLNHTGLTH